MKLRNAIFASVAVVFVATTSANAAEANVSYREILAKVPSAEMPAKAVQIVKLADPQSQEGVTVEVVKAAIKLSPGAASTLVAAISREIPQVSAKAAGAAANALPKQAPEIARAAAAAAPGKAGQIVAAVCRAAPSQYKRIALAVSKVVPSAGKEIVEAIGVVFPDLQVRIEAALASYGSSSASLSVAAVLDAIKNPNLRPVVQENDVVHSAGTLPSTPPRGPTIGPPFVPYSSSGPNVTPTDSGPVPRGDRNYAAP